MMLLYKFGCWLIRHLPQNHLGEGVDDRVLVVGCHEINRSLVH